MGSREARGDGHTASDRRSEPRGVSCVSLQSARPAASGVRSGSGVGSARDGPVRDGTTRVRTPRARATGEVAPGEGASGLRRRPAPVRSERWATLGVARRPGPGGVARTRRGRRAKSGPRDRLAAAGTPGPAPRARYARPFVAARPARRRPTRRRRSGRRRAAGDSRSRSTGTSRVPGSATRRDDIPDRSPPKGAKPRGRRTPPRDHPARRSGGRMASRSKSARAFRALPIPNAHAYVPVRSNSHPPRTGPRPLPGPARPKHMPTRLPA